jgi:3D (Asp-Asp-Asp) domain-containing protein
MRAFCNLLLTFLAFFGFPATQASNVMIDMRPEAKKIDVKKIKVRITGYWPGEDEWSSRYQSSTGTRLRAGRHCAVDPDIIPLWSKIRVMGGRREWLAVDTGTAVKSKKASGGKLPVIDIFAASEKHFNEMRLPRVAMVEVVEVIR